MKVAAALLVMLAFVPPAVAQDLRTLAKQHFDDGRRDFDARAYAPALEHFRQSYSLAPYPQLLFNIARCLEELGRYPEAVVEYERYLAVAPRDEDARARVAELKRKIGDQPMALAESPGPPAPSPSPSPLLAPPPPVAAAPVYRRWWFWTAIAGVVVAGAAVGLGVGLSQPTPSLTFPALNAR